MVKQLFGKICLVGLCLLSTAMLFFMGLLTVADARTYSDNLSFETLEDAREFQDNLIQTALDYGGKITNNNLTLTSPPQLSYTVILPGNDYKPEARYFPIGNPVGSVGASWGMIAFGSIMAMIPFGAGIYLLTRPLSFFEDTEESKD